MRTIPKVESGGRWWIRAIDSNGYGRPDRWRGHHVKLGLGSDILVAGDSWINANNVFAHGILYGGFSLSGLGGGVLGPESLLDYIRPQSVARPLK